MEEIFELLSLIYPLSPACLGISKKLLDPAKFQERSRPRDRRCLRSPPVFHKKGVALLCTSRQFPIGFFARMRPSSLSEATMTSCRAVMWRWKMQTLLYYKDQYDYICKTFLEFNIARVLLEKCAEFHSHARLIHCLKAAQALRTALKSTGFAVNRILWDRWQPG